MAAQAQRRSHGGAVAWGRRLRVTQVLPSTQERPCRYTCHMDNDERLDRYLELCKRIYERMRRDGTWPWADSQDSEGMVESENNPHDL